MSVPALSPPTPEIVLRDVQRALAEDMGSGDVTATLLSASAQARAHLVTRDAAVLCGCAWAEACFRELDRLVRVQWYAHDGETLAPGARLCRIEGEARALVSGERTALNFLQTLSATATTTASYVEAVRGTRAKILDTRKTLPGLRMAQKHAVRAGGGHNHRLGLFDAVLIKENHIAALGSIAAAVERARALHPGLFVEVEVEDFHELHEAIDAGADRIMLDEFELHELGRAVAETAGRVPLEVSGSVSLERVRTIARTGVDFISVGALTKHVHAIDLSMRIDMVDGSSDS